MPNEVTHHEIVQNDEVPNRPQEKPFHLFLVAAPLSCHIIVMPFESNVTRIDTHFMLNSHHSLTPTSRGNVPQASADTGCSFERFWKKAIFRCLVVIVLAGLLLSNGNADAQDDTTPMWLNHRVRTHLSSSRDSGEMMKLLQPFSRKVSHSIVQVFSGRRAVALGMVVAADGYVLTKRSELTGDVISVRFSNGEKLSARVAAVRRSSDLALLKVDSSRELKPLEFATETPSIGSFLISPNRSGRMIGLGVVGVAPRRVEHRGRLGVRLEESANGQALVGFVLPQSGASLAGIQERDRILAVNGQSAPGRDSVIQQLRKIYPGEIVELTILRGNDSMELKAMISDMGMLEESENDSKVNGPRSVRLSGFERVIQHDTVLQPHECGGPVLNSSGEVVGMNIARAGRVVSYALPTSLIVPEVLNMLTEARGNP